MACVCHLAALSAAAGLKVMPFSVDQLLIDIYYHFKHSSKRCQEFADVLADFQDIVPINVLKHCTTCWLSLERAVKRLLHLWPALHAYFDREAEVGNDRARKIAEKLASDETKLYVSFVVFALKPLNVFNTAFQSTTSKIGSMQGDVLQLLRSYMANFVDPEVLRQAPDILDIDYASRDQQVGSDELGVGTETRMLLIAMEDDGSVEVERRFFSNVCLFYESTVRKIIAKFPFGDKTLADLQVLNPASRLQVSVASVVRLAKRFTGMSSDDIDPLVTQLRDYKTVQEEQLPAVDGDIVQFWARLGKVMMPGYASQPCFPKLRELATILLVHPHANADPERLFSMVGKIETQQRGSLLPSTVRDLISVKVNNLSHVNCHTVTFPPALAKEAKTATTRKLADAGEE